MLYACWYVLEDGGVGRWRFCSEPVGEQVSELQLMVLYVGVVYLVPRCLPTAIEPTVLRSDSRHGFFGSGNTEALIRPPDPGAPVALNEDTYNMSSAD